MDAERRAQVLHLGGTPRRLDQAGAAPEGRDLMLAGAAAVTQPLGCEPNELAARPTVVGCPSLSGSTGGDALSLA